MKRYIRSATNDSSSKRTYTSLLQNFLGMLGYKRIPSFVDPTRYGYRLGWSLDEDMQIEFADKVRDMFGFEVRFTKPGGHPVIPYGALEDYFNDAAEFVIAIYNDTGERVGYIKKFTAYESALPDDNEIVDLTSNINTAQIFYSQDMANNFIDKGYSSVISIVYYTYKRHKFAAVRDGEIDEYINSFYNSTHADYECIPLSSLHFEIEQKS